MSEQRDESRLVECSQCGKRMGAEGDVLGTGKRVLFANVAMRRVSIRI